MNRQSMFPNQDGITIKKAEEYLRENALYSKINIQALEIAVQVLSPSGLKLWLYFDKNRDGYEFGLSRIDAMQFCKFSLTSYKAAKNDLKDKGFLVENGAHSYDFYELPDEYRQLDNVTIHKSIENEGVHKK